MKPAYDGSGVNSDFASGVLGHASDPERAKITQRINTPKMLVETRPPSLSELHIEANIENLYWSDVDPVLPLPLMSNLRHHFGNCWIDVTHGRRLFYFRRFDLREHVAQIFEQLDR